MNHILLVAIGGAIGATCRFLLGGFIQQKFASAMPWGTLIVNVVGCFLIGLLMRAFDGNAISESVKLLVITGFLGALTTFSTFGYDTLLCFRGNGLPLALANIGSNVVAGILAVILGITVWDFVR